MACCVRSFSFSCVRLIIIQIYCCYKDNLITGSDVPSLLHGCSRIIIRLIVYNLFFDLQHFMNSGSCFVCGHFSFDLLRGVARFGGENFFVDGFAFDRPGKDFNLDFGDTWLVVDLN